MLGRGRGLNGMGWGRVVEGEQYFKFEVSGWFGRKLFGFWRCAVQ